jgi:hypothetical protein
MNETGVMLNAVKDPSPWQGEGGGRGHHLGSGSLSPLGADILRFVPQTNVTGAMD